MRKITAEEYDEIITSFLAYRVDFVEYKKRHLWFFTEDCGYRYTNDHYKAWDHPYNRGRVDAVREKAAEAGLQHPFIIDFTTYENREKCVNACHYLLRSSNVINVAKDMASKYLKHNNLTI